MMVDHLGQLCLRQHTPTRLFEFTVLEQHQGRDATDLETCRGIRILIYVELSHFESSIIG